MKFATLGLLMFSMGHAQDRPSADSYEKWEKEIAAIEKRLKELPPKKGDIVFAGSSSIRLWKLAEPFPDAVNVGFGGSVIRDSTYFADRIILPHEPATIVFYAGDNDISAKRTPEQVRQDFEAFAKVIHEKRPKTRILWLAIKPSIKRWEMYDTQKKANELVEDFCAKDARFTFVDTVKPLLGEDGKPVTDFFVQDGLHLSERGYAVWNELVKKALK